MLSTLDFKWIIQDSAIRQKIDDAFGALERRFAGLPRDAHWTNLQTLNPAHNLLQLHLTPPRCGCLGMLPDRSGGV